MAYTEYYHPDQRGKCEEICKKFVMESCRVYPSFRLKPKIHLLLLSLECSLQLHQAVNDKKEELVRTGDYVQMEDNEVLNDMHTINLPTPSSMGNCWRASILS